MRWSFSLRAIGVCVVIVGLGLSAPAQETLGPGAAALLSRGDAQLKAKDWRGAIATFDDVLAREPTNEKALSGRGHAKYFLHDWKGAADDLTTALGIDPNDWSAHFYRGRSYDRLDRQNDAIKDLDAAIRIDPRREPAWSIRGRIRGETHDLAGALQDFREALKLVPNDVVARAWLSVAEFGTKQYRAAIDDATTVLRTAPDTPENVPARQDALLARANAEFAVNESRAAEADCTTYLRRSPNDEAILALRGAVRHYLGNEDGAIADLNAALQRDPANELARKMSAVAYASRWERRFDREDVNGALADGEALVHLRPDSPSAHLMRGFARLMSRDYSGAESDARVFIAARPKEVFGPALLASVKTFEGNRREALAFADHAVALMPAAFVFTLRGMIKNHFCDSGGALSDARAALHVDPNATTARLLRANVNASLKHYDAVLVDANAVLGHDRRSPDGFIERGIAYRHLGKVDLAIADYTRAIALAPTRATPYADRAFAEAGIAADLHASAPPSSATPSKQGDDPGTLTAGSALFVLGARIPSPVSLVSLIHFHFGAAPASASQVKDADREQRENRAAYADLRTAERNDPRDANTIAYEGVIAARLHLYDDAIGAFSRALKLKSDDYETLLARGYAYSQLGRREQAMRDFQAAVAMLSSPAPRVPEGCTPSRRDPSDAYDAIGSELRIRGDYGESLRWLDRAVAANPGNADAWYDRAEVHRQRHETAQALADLHHAADLLKRKGDTRNAASVSAEIAGLGG